MPSCFPLLAFFLLFPAHALSRGDIAGSHHPAPFPSAVAGISMVGVPAGTFRMGSGWEDDPRNPHRERGIFRAELPVHTVALSGFFMSATEITQGQYRKIMGTNPSRFTGDDNLPVERTSWWEAIRFCNALSDAAGLTRCYHEQTGACDFDADGFRLPTEAEWEYACRAGTDTRYYLGESPSPIREMPPGWADSLDTGSDLGRAGWYSGNSGNRNLTPFFLEPEILAETGCRSHPVGGKAPNAWGLYDMPGNVYEWCNDWYGPYPPGRCSDPSGAKEGAFRVKRGGGWGSYSNRCTSFGRSGNKPDTRNSDLGFRVVRRVR